MSKRRTIILTERQFHAIIHAWASHDAMCGDEPDDDYRRDCVALSRLKEAWHGASTN